MSQITLKVKFLRNEERQCLLPSLVDDFTCVHSKNALLTHILSTLFSSTSVLFSCTLFGTKSYIWPILKTWTLLMVSCLPTLKVNLRLCCASQFFFLLCCTFNKQIYMITMCWLLEQKCSLFVWMNWNLCKHSTWKRDTGTDV